MLTYFLCLYWEADWRPQECSKLQDFYSALIVRVIIHLSKHLNKCCLTSDLHAFRDLFHRLYSRPSYDCICRICWDTLRACLVQLNTYLQSQNNFFTTCFWQKEIYRSLLCLYYELKKRMYMPESMHICAKVFYSADLIKYVQMFYEERWALNIWGHTITVCGNWIRLGDVKWHLKRQSLWGLSVSADRESS